MGGGVLAAVSVAALWALLPGAADACCVCFACDVPPVCTETATDCTSFCQANDCAGGNVFSGVCADIPSCVASSSPSPVAQNLGGWTPPTPVSGDDFDKAGIGPLGDQMGVSGLASNGTLWYFQTDTLSQQAITTGVTSTSKNIPSDGARSYVAYTDSSGTPFVAITSDGQMFTLTQVDSGTGYTSSYSNVRNELIDAPTNTPAPNTPVPSPTDPPTAGPTPVPETDTICNSYHQPTSQEIDVFCSSNGGTSWTQAATIPGVTGGFDSMSKHSVAGNVTIYVTLDDPGQPFHPLFNSYVWKVDTLPSGNSQAATLLSNGVTQLDPIENDNPVDSDAVLAAGAANFVYTTGTTVKYARIDSNGSIQQQMELGPVDGTAVGISISRNGFLNVAGTGGFGHIQLSPLSDQVIPVSGAPFADADDVAVDGDTAAFTGSLFLAEFNAFAAVGAPAMDDSVLLLLAAGLFVLALSGLRRKPGRD